MMVAKMTCPRCGYTWRATLNGWLWHVRLCKADQQK